MASLIDIQLIRLANDIQVTLLIQQNSFIKRTQLIEANNFAFTKKIKLAFLVT